MTAPAPKPLDLARIDSLLGSGSKFNAARSGKRPVDEKAKFRRNWKRKKRD